MSVCVCSHFFGPMNFSQTLHVSPVVSHSLLIHVPHSLLGILVLEWMCKNKVTIYLVAMRIYRKKPSVTAVHIFCWKHKQYLAGSQWFNKMKMDWWKWLRCPKRLKFRFYREDLNELLLLSTLPTQHSSS